MAPCLWESGRHREEGERAKPFVPALDGILAFALTTTSPQGVRSVYVQALVSAMAFLPTGYISLH